MPDNNMNMGAMNQQRENRSDCCNNNGGLFNGLFGRNGDCCGDSKILFFIIIFLLLFTNFGCCDR